MMGFVTSILEEAITGNGTLRQARAFARAACVCKRVRACVLACSRAQKPGASPPAKRRRPLTAAAAPVSARPRRPVDLILITNPATRSHLIHPATRTLVAPRQIGLEPSGPLLAALLAATGAAVVGGTAATAARLAKKQMTPK
jgi:hypothetical protein